MSENGNHGGHHPWWPAYVHCERKTERKRETKHIAVAEYSSTSTILTKSLHSSHTSALSTSGVPKVNTCLDNRAELFLVAQIQMSLQSTQLRETAKAFPLVTVTSYLRHPTRRVTWERRRSVDSRNDGPASADRGLSLTSGLVLARNLSVCIRHTMTGKRTFGVCF